LKGKEYRVLRSVERRVVEGKGSKRGWRGEEKNRTGKGVREIIIYL